MVEVRARCEAEGRDPSTLRFSLYSRDEDVAPTPAQPRVDSSADSPRSGWTGSSPSRPAGRRPRRPGRLRRGLRRGRAQPGAAGGASGWPSADRTDPDRQPARSGTTRARRAARPAPARTGSSRWAARGRPPPPPGRRVGDEPRLVVGQLEVAAVERHALAGPGRDALDRERAAVRLAGTRRSTRGVASASSSGRRAASRPRSGSAPCWPGGWRGATALAVDGAATRYDEAPPVGGASGCASGQAAISRVGRRRASSRRRRSSSRRRRSRRSSRAASSSRPRRSTP